MPARPVVPSTSRPQGRGKADARASARDRSVFSMRVAASTLGTLQEEAARYRVPPRTLAEDILEEGLKMHRHSGIVFVERGGGRDAVLAGHPRLSIWQIALTIRASRSIEEAARYLSLDVGSVERAAAYAAEYRDEIEAAIADNEAAFERAKRLYPQALGTKRERRAAPARRAL